MGLLIAANGYLADQKQYASDTVIESVGTELATELETVGRLARNSQQASLQSSQPRDIVSNAYSVELRSPGECTLGMAANACLVVEITRTGENTVREFAVQNRSDVRLSIDRVDQSTFGVSATKTTGVTTDAAVVPVEQDLRVGVGADVGRSGGQNITNLQQEAPIIENFTISPGFPTSNETVTFSANTTDPDGTVVNHTWYIDGTPHPNEGNTFTTTSPLPPGEHNVTLKVTDNDGLTASKRPRGENVTTSGLTGTIVDSGSGSSGDYVELELTNHWPKDVVLGGLNVDAGSGYDYIHYIEGSVDGDEDCRFFGCSPDTPDPEIKIDYTDDGSWNHPQELNGADPATLTDGERYITITSTDMIDRSDTATVRIRGLRGGGDPADTTFRVEYWVTIEGEDVAVSTIVNGGS
ncbi:PKD domain-containing protein [Halorhabdus sp. CBA1104]|uniref:PKD domain-containing protein n=1 Tax=Halorhabdus sp. CBA1104 TaxID=1380432 RepID=UPI0018A6CCC2|nr:PKD domain-containing protein [Halorhabdus sp. CBA1104]